ncbi:MAG: hypothetical protein C4334_06570 [Pyrinomonas sp.]
MIESQLNFTPGGHEKLHLRRRRFQLEVRVENSRGLCGAERARQRANRAGHATSALQCSRCFLGAWGAGCSAPLCGETTRQPCVEEKN